MIMVVFIMLHLHQWKVPKVLHVVRPAIHLLLVPVHAIIGSKILATPLAGKHTPTVMMTHVLVKCGKYWHRLESLSQTSQG